MALNGIGINLARARRNRSSNFLANVPSILTQATRSDPPLTLVACGDKLNEVLAKNQMQWIDIPARVLLAQIISQASTNRFRDAPQEFSQTKIWAELAATWCDESAPTIEAMEAARRSIETVLNGNPPSDATLIASMHTHITQLIANTGAGTLPWNDVVDVLPTDAVVVDEVTIQKADYYTASLHAFSYLIFCNPNDIYTACSEALNLPNADIVNIPDIVLVARQDYREQWVRAPIEQKLAILEMIYYANQAEYNSLILAVAVGVTFALGKVTGFTDAWLASRIAQVATLNPGLNIADKVTPATLSDFQTRYVMNKMDSDVLYNFLSGVYPSFSQTSLNSLNWVIEQTRAQAMTHVLSYCGSLIEFDYLPFSLMPKITPAQYEALLKAAVSFVIDPWGSTFGPVYAASTYPDLANFGVRGQMLRDKQMRKYEGKWIAGGSMSRLQIDSVLSQCTSHMEMVIESSADPVERLRETMVGVTIREIGDQIYIFDDTNLALNMTPRAIAAEFARARPAARQNEEQEGFWGEYVPDEEADRERRAAARRAWPAAARNLPINAVAISPVQAMKITVSLFPTTPMMRAVQAISGMVLQVAKQVPLKAYGPLASNIQVLGRFNADLHQPVNRILQEVNLTVEGIVPTYVAPKAVVEYNERTMVTGADNKRPRRPVVGRVVRRALVDIPYNAWDVADQEADEDGQ